MKKLFTFLLILSMALPLLTSCVPEEWTAEESTAPVPVPVTPGTSGVTPGGESDGNDLGYAASAAYGFTVFPDGDYLADPKFDTDEYLPGYDADYSFGQNGTSCASDDAVFFADVTLSLSGRNSYRYTVMYIDRESLESGVLCADPECGHTEKKCRAYMGDFSWMGSAEIFMYDDGIYWTKDNNVYRMATDGTEKKLVMHVSGDGLDKNWQQYVIRNGGGSVIHRDCVYFYGSDSTTAAVIAAPLDGGEPFTVFQRTYTDSRYLSDVTVRCVGNYIYILISYWTDNDAYGIELYRWNSKTRVGERLFAGQLDGSTSGESTSDGSASGDTGSEKFVLYGVDFFPVPGDGVYLKKQHVPSDEGGDVSEYYEGVCKYSFATGEIEHVSWFEYEGEHIGIDYITDEYFISRHDGGIYVFDHDCVLLYRTGSIGEELVFEGVEKLFPDYSDKYWTARNYDVFGIDDDYIFCTADVTVNSVSGDGSASRVYYHSAALAIPRDGGEVRMLSVSGGKTSG